MSKSHEYRKQAGLIAPPTDTGVVRVYANASGYLQFVNADGTTGNASAAFSQNISQANGTITTGIARFGNGATYSSGAYYGSTGTNTFYTEFLGAPNLWLVVSAPSGGKYVVPAYSYV